jgi:hypothetical protein
VCFRLRGADLPRPRLPLFFRGESAGPAPRSVRMPARRDATVFLRGIAESFHARRGRSPQLHARRPVRQPAREGRKYGVSLVAASQRMNQPRSFNSSNESASSCFSFRESHRTAILLFRDLAAITSVPPQPAVAVQHEHDVPEPKKQFQLRLRDRASHEAQSRRLILVGAGKPAKRPIRG